jgi:catechol 2,3-dioxygenase-like lactoylglutathione lyase family enzyme
MRMEQVDFVSVSTRDYERAAKWYCEVLGLPLDFL